MELLILTLHDSLLSIVTGFAGMKSLFSPLLKSNVFVFIRIDREVIVVCCGEQEVRVAPRGLMQ